MEFLIDYWQWFLLAFFLAEKIVKITPTDKDDIALDIIWAGIKKAKDIIKKPKENQLS